MSEELARWACRLTWLQLEPCNCHLPQVGTHPPLGHGPCPTHLHWSWNPLSWWLSSINHYALFLPTKKGAILLTGQLIPHDPNLTPMSPERKVQVAVTGEQKALTIHRLAEHCSLLTYEPLPGAQQSWLSGGWQPRQGDGVGGGFTAEHRTGRGFSTHCFLAFCTATSGSCLWTGYLFPALPEGSVLITHDNRVDRGAKNVCRGLPAQPSFCPGQPQSCWDRKMGRKHSPGQRILWATDKAPAGEQEEGEATRGRGSSGAQGFCTMSSFHQGIEDSPQHGLNGFVPETTHSAPREANLPDPVPRSGKSLRSPGKLIISTQETDTELSTLWLT